MRLPRQFYNRPTITVARNLLGKYLVRRIKGQIIKTKIIETEAYCGPKDLANHASKGLTPRTKVMFGPAGHSYVYMIYGMYHCLNVVTEREGYPAAVLIRSVSSIPYSVHRIKGKKIQNTGYKILNTNLNGPGKLCRELKIDRILNGIDMCRGKELWLEDNGEKINTRKIKKGKRIGVNYAGPYKDKLWRFYLTHAD